jgi:hypothetical protein
MNRALVMSGMEWWKKNLLQEVTNNSEAVLSKMANGKGLTLRWSSKVAKQLNLN